GRRGSRPRDRSSSGSPAALQRPARAHQAAGQLQPAAVDAALHRAQRDLEGVRRLLVGEPLEIAQDERLAQVGGQGAQAAVDDPRLLRALEAAQWALVTGRNHVEHGGILDAARSLLAPAAIVVDGMVACDGTDPCSEGPVRLTITIQAL